MSKIAIPRVRRMTFTTTRSRYITYVGCEPPDEYNILPPIHFAQPMGMQVEDTLLDGYSVRTVTIHWLVG